MILALLAVAASTASIDCVSEQGQLAAWRPAIEAYRSRDMPKAKAAADAIIAGCGDSPLATIARTMRAEIAVTEGDHDGALALLGSQPRPEAAPAGPYTSLIALRAWQGKKDASRFADERTRLLEGSAKGLGAPGNAFKSRLIETFDTNGVRVSAFETDFADGPFRRYFVFLLAPDEAFAMPGTIMLSADGAAGLLGGGPVYFVDEYGCWGHATLEVIEKRKPDYKAMKARVMARLAGKLQPTSSIEPGGVCAFSGYVSPGFAPPRLDE